MARLNVPKEPLRTYEGGVAKHITPEQQLRRSLMSCLLWEKTFYEDGIEIADRIASLVPLANPPDVALLALKARLEMYLRHAPLLVTREMARYGSHKGFVANTLEAIIQRPDELAEFLAIYWKDGRCPLSAQVKKGLARAFTKFDAYQLAKYNRDNDIKLRDVLFLCHAKPETEKQGLTWKKLVEGTLEPPDTWEVALSTGADKKTTWERLLRDGKLGGMALLRNLRNMDNAGIDETLIFQTLSTGPNRKILPFRYIAAANAVPKWEDMIELAMLRSLQGFPKLLGHTVLLLDVSGSMENSLSLKSDITRMDAACGVAMLAREICEKVDIFTFSMALKQIPPRHGFSLRDSIIGSQGHNGTPLGLAVKSIYASKEFRQDEYRFDWRFMPVDYRGQDLSPHRLIVITDEQSHDSVPDPQSHGYMVNIASNRNGIGYGPWTHIDGWSDSVIRYIQEMEEEIGDQRATR